jgi:FAD dependent oxidoreductase
MASINTSFATRALPKIDLSSDLIVAGGGLAGICAAVTAARQGVRVILVQDRPVLGGNASSEVRLWVLGATSHMGNNNRWAREGGVIDELLVENIWRNPEGNSVIFDSILLEVVVRETNIRLLLNTAIDNVELDASGAIAAANAYCSQNQTCYHLAGPLFCDASGDGILGFLAGAAFRIGAEARSEFNEALAPEWAAHDLLGHSLYFYSRDTGRPVTYVAPSFALSDITKIPRFRELRITDSGCRLWWLEYGGLLDTVHETEEIKWELWRVAYGVWNYIKNSGEFPDAETLTLEWMGMIPGKRESRRFEGEYMLTQQDIVEQTVHTDAVSFGGWAIDLHPAEGVFSAKPGCTQWHSKGVYQIPYRTMYSRNVPNLFLAGRIISASHIAFGSTRVMATCAHNGQAVGMAAALCFVGNLRPRELTETCRMHTLQQQLLRVGQHIPGIAATADQAGQTDMARSATVTASSTFELETLPASGETIVLDRPMAILLPLTPGSVPIITVFTTAEQPTSLNAELWISSREGNTTPDLLLSSIEIEVPAGASNSAIINFHATTPRNAYAFVVLLTNPLISLALNHEYLCGVLTLSQQMNPAVAKSPVQAPPEGSGIDTFAFWLPTRRPAARNLACTFTPSIPAFAAANVVNGYARPFDGTNAWVPGREDKTPTLYLTWDEPQTIRTIEITFDTDYDHPMESVLMGHPERVMPGCITAFEIRTSEGTILAHVEDNHQTRFQLQLEAPLNTCGISIAVLSFWPSLPAIFEVRCY